MAPLWNEEGHVTFFSSVEESSTTISLNARTREETLPLATKSSSRRTVSFSPEAAFHVDAVMHLDDYSESERLDCWYQPGEMMEIRREVKETVALMNRNVPMDDVTRLSAEMNAAGMDVKEITTHGLEGKTKAGKRHRKDVRLASLAAVFEEQTSQDMDGICDPIMIARAYAEYAYPMQVAALKRAALYQNEVAASRQKDEQRSYLEDVLTCPEPNLVVQATFESTKPECRETLEEVKSTEVAAETTTSPRMNDMPASSELVTMTINNNDGNFENNIENVENDEDVNSPFYVGPLRIRDRFACLLPGSSSNGTQSL
eukprot:CAMPEP_0116124702 /NCGR_PEP_ID=MMETSP0329-20121206/5418_1 /TAXON_ID=697910 /ORGANISM="Pseudo-nitzschia arenysensis, Strain B593" /LENGTH=315 /DNA_ID=CAMNT_0003618693 /DNA_START=29 /DNA_END=973 /DNA_ORIENTATION=-